MAKAETPQRGEPRISLDAGLSPGRLDDATQERDDGYGTAQPADDRNVERRTLRTGRRRGGQVVLETDAHSGFLVGAAGRADRHPLWHAAAAMDAPACLRSCFGGCHAPFRRSVILEEAGHVGGCGAGFAAFDVSSAGEGQLECVAQVAFGRCNRQIVSAWGTSFHVERCGCGIRHPGSCRYGARVGLRHDKPSCAFRALQPLSRRHVRRQVQNDATTLALNGLRHGF